MCNLHIYGYHYYKPFGLLGGVTVRQSRLKFPRIPQNCDFSKIGVYSCMKLYSLNVSNLRCVLTFVVYGTQ